MLPFLTKKTVSSPGISSSITMTSGDSEKDKIREMDGLKACADDLLKAIHSHDKDALIHAMRAVFQILDAEPHEEGEHLSSEE